LKRSALSGECGLNEIGDGLLNRVRARAQSFNDWVKFERLPFSERYAVGGLEIGFLFMVGAEADGVKGSVIAAAALKQNIFLCLRVKKAHDLAGFEGWSLRGSGEQLIQHVFGEIHGLARKNEKAMFVAGVEAMKPTENFIPARIWLERAYQLDNVCSGEVYLSAFNSSAQGFWFSDEWEHQFERTGGLIVRHPIERHIQSGTEIVNGIADDKRHFIWNWFQPPTDDCECPRIGLVLDEKSKWSLRQKGVDGRLKLLDVILGPLDFKFRCEGERLSGEWRHGKSRSDERSGISKSGADLR
jgi:hypothetical protein